MIDTIPACWSGAIHEQTPLTTNTSTSPGTTGGSVAGSWAVGPWAAGSWAARSAKLASMKWQLSSLAALASPRARSM